LSTVNVTVFHLELKSLYSIDVESVRRNEIDAHRLSVLQKEIRPIIEREKRRPVAHYYQRAEIQEIADILGDSLALSMEAARTDAEVLVFAGGAFMAESASILSAGQTVLLPKPDAGCPLADMITPEKLLTARKNHPHAAVVTYINSSVAIKAMSDICCTSANAVKIVNSLRDAKEILMVPDGNLACYVAGLTNKKIIPWDGYCPVHHHLTAEDVSQEEGKISPGNLCGPSRMPTGSSGPGRLCRQYHRDHPVCRSGRFQGDAGGYRAWGFLSVKKTESGKTFIPISDQMICADMKKITLKDILAAITEMKTVVKVPEEVRIPAKKALGPDVAIS